MNYKLFSLKSRSSAWLLFVLIGLLATAAIMTLFVVRQPDPRSEQKVLGEKNQSAEAQVAQTQANYQTALADFQTSLSTATTLSAVQTAGETFFLGINVPEELLDSHLKGFLAYQSLMSSAEAVDLASIKISLTEILVGLSN